MTGCDDRFSVSLFMDGSVLYFAGKKERMNRIQLIFNEKWAMAREDYYNLVSLILPSIHSGNFKEVEAFLKKIP